MKGSQPTSSGAVRLAAAFFLLLVSLPGIAAQEYSLLGTINMESGWFYTPGGVEENQLDSLLCVDAGHRLDYDKFSFIARHRLEVDRLESMDHFLDEAYIDYRPADVISLGLGKQRISWGRGIAFFPTDTLHPSRSRTDTEGFTGLSVILNPGPNLQLTGAVDFSAPLGNEGTEKFYEDLRYALYAGLYLGNADLALSAVYRDDNTFRPGIGFSLDLLGFILTAEGAAEFINRSDFPDPDTVDFLAVGSTEPSYLVSGGISRSLVLPDLPDLSFMAVAEYLYAGNGYSIGQSDRFFDIIQDYLESGESYPEIAYLGQHYLFGLLSLEWYQALSFEFAGYFNLQDTSSSLNATLTFLGIEGLDLGAVGTMLTGESRTEFGSLKSEAGEYSLSLAATVYF